MNAIDLTIPAFLDRTKDKPLVFSYTMLHTYANICGYQAYRRYVKKDIPYVATPAMEYGNKVHEAFELRVGGGKPLPAAFQQWEPFAAAFDGLNAKTEIKVAVTDTGHPTGYFDKNVRIRGKVDLFAVQNGKGFLADWKTGGSKYEDPYELEIGAMLLRATYPQVESIQGSYVWLKEDRMGQVYDLSHVAKTWAKTNELMQQMQADRQSGQWEKRKSGLCGWCPVEDCEHHYVAEKK